MYCVIDFETRSPADIKKIGAWNYSKHPGTEILCASVWDSVSKSVRTWEVDPFAGIPPKWFTDLYDQYPTWVAHNAFFEIAMWKNNLARRFNLPCPPLKNWQDTKAIALSWSIPGSLAGASAVLGREEKDKDGHRLMLKMCKPRKPTKKDPSIYHWTPEDFDRLVKYCEQDVIATNAIIEDLGVIQKVDRPIYEIDKQINTSGFCIDTELVDSAVIMVNALIEGAKRDLSQITDGFIQTPNQHARFKAFALDHGVKMKSTDKAAVVALLKRKRIPDIVRKVFEIRQLLGKSSVAKYTRAALQVDRGDNRIRDAFVFHKASTGRWAGQGFQPQNLTRGELKLNDAQVEDAIAAVKARNIQYIEHSFGNPMQVLSDLVRPVIVAPEGSKFVAADFASVEARGVLWLAGETAAVKMLSAGGDIYKEMASAIFGKPISEITPIERFIGKTAILGLGYGMGAERFMIQTNADALKFGFDVQIDMGLAQKVVDTYRISKYPRIPIMWRGLESAFKLAIVTGKPQTSYGVTFYRKKPRVIACRLLSGREIHYWDCKIGSFVMASGKGDVIASRSDGISYNTVGPNGKFSRTGSWGGKIVENIVQGVCSDLLRNSMLAISRRTNWDIVMTAHDEIVCETPDTHFYNPDKMVDIITKLPPWGAGFPLNAEGWEGKRFRK